MDDMSRRFRLLPFVMICAAGMLAAACQSSAGTQASGNGGGNGGTGSTGPSSGQTKTSKPKPPDTGLTISPATGSTNVNPAKGITVSSTKGKIKSVVVTGDEVTGKLNGTGTQWHSDWTLPVDATLHVTATAVNTSGQTVHLTSTFKTLNPSSTVRMQIFEGFHQTYGVGMPVILTFSSPIKNKAAVEKSLVLTSSKPVVGGWYWDNDQTLVFRPRQYWPQNTTVSFTGHLNGVEAAPGVYGYHTLTQQFKIGRSLIVVASTASHHMKLYKDGKLYRTWPISSGKPGDNTPNGTYLTIEKGNPVLMKGPGYRLEVPWSVRFTWSGDYLHDAYWSTGEQGFTNVSHGCVNMAPADAEAYYKLAVPGDPVTILGSPKHGVWDNGWTYWFLSWEQFVKGSALHMAVEVSPHGSTFVAPTALTAAKGSAPLNQPWPKNSWAS